MLWDLQKLHSWFLYIFQWMLDTLAPVKSDTAQRLPITCQHAPGVYVGQNEWCCLATSSWLKLQRSLKTERKTINRKLLTIQSWITKGANFCELIRHFYIISYTLANFVTSLYMTFAKYYWVNVNKQRFKWQAQSWFKKVYKYLLIVHVIAVLSRQNSE